MGLFSTSSPYDSDVGKFITVLSSRHKHTVLKLHNFNFKSLSMPLRYSSSPKSYLNFLWCKYSLAERLCDSLNVIKIDPCSYFKEGAFGHFLK